MLWQEPNRGDRLASNSFRSKQTPWASPCIYQGVPNKDRTHEPNIFSSPLTLGDVHAHLGADLAVPPPTKQSAGYSAGKGYDRVTGLGSLDAFTFSRHGGTEV
jgi:hypothetical protein